MSTTLRDALQIQRLNTMRRRSAEAQAKARRDAGNCQCLKCQLQRGLGGATGLAALLSKAAADAEPADLAAIAPSRAH
jgi:hypothetical protein